MLDAKPLHAQGLGTAVRDSVARPIDTKLIERLGGAALCRKSRSHEVANCLHGLDDAVPVVCAQEVLHDEEGGGRNGTKLALLSASAARAQQAHQTATIVSSTLLGVLIAAEN
jgi:hypothetical protein